MLVHIVADYGQGDLAFAEVAQRIKLYLLDAEPVTTPLPPFTTLAAGFCVAPTGRKHLLLTTFTSGRPLAGTDRIRAQPVRIGSGCDTIERGPYADVGVTR